MSVVGAEYRELRRPTSLNAFHIACVSGKFNGNPNNT